ncbi:MAG: YiiX/YebB-like N1pC/P60 family cysteine hydrolase, partial [Bacteroidota bacterium]
MAQRLLCFALIVGWLLVSCENRHPKEDLQPGDIVFQDLDCGPMCDAIEAVTEGANGKDYSHCGMIIQEGDSLKVIEAIGEGVVVTSWKDFVGRSSKIQAARLKTMGEAGVQRAIGYAISLIGKPYDDAFLLNNDRYYCSELLYEAFIAANYGKEVFQLSPMTFKEPNTLEYYPVWVDYYSKLKCPIPEGKPGLNPGGISRS